MSEVAQSSVSDPSASGKLTRRRRLAKWTLIAVAAVLAVLAAGAMLFNTSLGQRFLADRVAATTFESGLNLRIGRIEGDLFGEVVLHDVQLSDPKGVFLTIPQTELDWSPSAWLSNRLEIAQLTARRGRLLRLPELYERQETGALFPGFDISCLLYTSPSPRDS